MELQVVESKMGKPVLLHSGYRLIKKKTYKNQNIFWVCSKNKNGCLGNATTNSTVTNVLNTKNHSCVPDIAKNEVNVCVFKAKKRAREEFTPVTQIYREELMTARDQGLDFITNVPSFSGIKTMLYSARQKSMGGTDLLPKHRKDLVIPQKFEDFVLIDDGREERILVFSENNKSLFRNGKCFFGDGTFKSCPKIFDQLYTIHMDLGSTEESTCVIPVLYALLPDRKAETYRRLFALLKIALPEFNPVEYHVDYEVAARNGIRAVFPDVKLKGCNFHFNQAIWRKIQELGLVKEYTENEEIRNHLRMCAAMAHLPPCYTDEGWLYIMESSPDNEQVNKFNDYFVEQWLEQEHIWICYGERHRTTNAAEGWHFRLNKIIGKNHPNVFELISTLKADAVFYSIIQQKRDLNLQTTKRPKKYRELDQRINTSLKSLLDNEATVAQTLQRLIYVVKFE